MFKKAYKLGVRDVFEDRSLDLYTQIAVHFFGVLASGVTEDMRAAMKSAVHASSFNTGPTIVDHSGGPSLL